MEPSDPKRRLLTRKKLPTSKESLYRRFDASLSKEHKTTRGAEPDGFPLVSTSCSGGVVGNILLRSPRDSIFPCIENHRGISTFRCHDHTTRPGSRLIYWDSRTPDMDKLRLALENAIPLGVPSFYQANPQWPEFIAQHKSSIQTGNEQPYQQQWNQTTQNDGF